MTLETFIKALRKAAGRGNNAAEVKFFHYNELTLNKIEQGKDGELVIAFGQPLRGEWETV